MQKNKTIGALSNELSDQLFRLIHSFLASLVKDSPLNQIFYVCCL